MKKLFLLTKTLLVAAGLLFGSANAWADKEYVTIWEKNFEDPETFTDGLTVTKTRSSASYTQTQYTRTDITSKAYHLYGSVYGGNASLTVSSISEFSADDYKFSMDFALTAPNNQEVYVIIKDKDKNPLFRTSNTIPDQGSGKGAAVESPIYINGSSTAESEKVLINTFRGGALTFYNVIITSNAVDGTSLTLYKYETTGTKSKVGTYSLNAGYIKLGSIEATSGNQSYGNIYYDNFSLSLDIAPYKTRAASATSAYNAVKAKVMNSTIKSTLDGAKSALDAFGDDAAIVADIPGYVSAISALETANGNAETSADNFAILNELIGNSKPAGYVAPTGAETKYTSNADVDPVSLASSVRVAIITAGTASENTDISGLIINNSFELQTTFGWTTVPSNDTGARNNNSPYTTSGIDGSYQFNTWSQGTPIKQNIGTLPAGRYKLACLVASDGGTIYLTMNDSHNEGTLTSDGGIFVNAEYTFTLASDTEVTIGAVGGDGDGNYTADGHWWYKADKFTITYLGEDPLEVAKKELNDEIDAATDVKNAWTPKVGTAPFKYNSTYYDALVTELGEANAVKTGGSEDPDDYNTAKTELETAKTAIASSVLIEPASDKYYRLYLAEDGVSTGKNLKMLKTGAGNAVISATPYPVKFVKSGDNYIIENPYNYYVTSNRVNNSNWGTFIDLDEDDSSSIDEELKPTTMYVNANVWGIELQEDGTFKMLSQQATWKAWGWYLGTWSSSEGATVAAYDGNASPKSPTKTTWLCSEPVEITDVNLAVNATTGWGTFIAPYDNLTPSTVKAYTVSHKNGNIVYFEENETGVLSANTPYILSTEESSNVAVAFKGIANNDEDTYSANGLVGLLTASTVPANSYILQYQAEKVGTAFYKLASNMTGTAYRCYLDLASVPTVQNARATVRMNIFGGITGVENVEVSAENALKDGKYLENGKIVIVKAGKKFSATGAKLY